MYKMQHPYQGQYDSMTEDERLMAYEAGQRFIDDYCELYDPRDAIERLLYWDYPVDLLIKMGFRKEDIDEALNGDDD